MTDLATLYEILDGAMDNKPCTTELENLRRRVTAQRRELRRLNKYYKLYWNGFHRALHLKEEMSLRGKMIKAFGKPAVSAAEHEGNGEG